MNKTLLLLVLGLIPGHAAPIFSNGAPNGLGGANSNDFRVAEDFSLTSSATVQYLRFWTFSQSTEPSDRANAPIAGVSWAIYSDDAGSPGSILFSGSEALLAGVAAGPDLGRREVPVNFMLNPGNYFIEIHTSTSLDTAGQLTFYWANADDNATTRYRSSTDLSATPVTEIPDILGSGLLQLAFELDTEPGPILVPEPVSRILTGAGLLLLALRRSTNTANVTASAGDENRGHAG